MEGLLLSYFRSAHNRSGSLHVIRDYRIAPPRGGDRMVDFAVVDGSTGQPLAVFEVANSVMALKKKRKLLETLRATFAGAPSVPLFGLVVPERLAGGDVDAWTDEAGVEVVTYAA
jgi:hypothetical protein